VGQARPLGAILSYVEEPHLPHTLLINPLIVIAIFVAVFASDSLLTTYAARIYQDGAGHVIGLEGSYELNPAFVNEVDQLRALSPRFLARIGMFSLLIWAFWYLSVQLSWLPQAYPFFVGAILLVQGPIHIRHIRNIIAFRHARTGDGIAGNIQYARRFSYWLSTVELLSFSGLYLLLALLAGSVLPLGGSFGTVVLALRSYQGWRKARPLPEMQ
jgi:hypothetical protein